MVLHKIGNLDPSGYPGPIPGVGIFLNRGDKQTFNKQRALKVLSKDGKKRKWF